MPREGTGFTKRSALPHGSLGVLLTLSVFLVLAQLWLHEDYRKDDQSLFKERERLSGYSRIIFEIQTHLSVARNSENTFLSSTRKQSTSEAQYTESIGALQKTLSILQELLRAQEELLLLEQINALRSALEKYHRSVQEITLLSDILEDSETGLLIDNIFSTLQTREAELISTLGSTEDVSIYVHQLQLLSRDFAISINLQELDQLRATLAELQPSTPQQQVALQNYRAEVDALERGILSIELEKASSLFQYEQMSRTLKEIDENLAHRRQLSSETLNQLRMRHQRTQRVLLALLIFSLMACLYVMSLSRRALVQRIQQLSEAMSSFVTGTPPDISRIEKSNGPLSRLSSQFVQMADQINQQFTQLTEAQQERVKREKLAVTLQERARAASLLAEREARFRSIFESAHDVMVVVDASGLVVDINRAGRMLLRCEGVAVSGQHLTTLFTAASGEQVQWALDNLPEQAVEATISSGIEVSLRIAEVTINEQPFFHVIAHDTSLLQRATRARQRLERRLQQAQQFELLGTLAGGIAHDVNNMLTPILGCAEMLSDVTEADPEAEELRQDILVSAHQAAALIQRILQFSRSTAQNLSPILVVESLQQLIRLVERNLPENIHFQAQTLDPTACIIGNPTELQQILSNLCSNAVDAMSDGGELSLSITTVAHADVTEEVRREVTAENLVKITIQDTGHGMSPEIMERVFEPYYSTKPITRGTGLGLATVFGIVRSLDGCIILSSQQGKGTVFDIYLPAVTDRPDPISLKAFQEPSLEGVQRVIVVDDEPLNVRLLERMLIPMGVQVTCFVSSPHALAYIVENHMNYDIIISDLTMPELNGVALLKEIRALDRLLPVIIYTGYGDPQNIRAVKAVGANLVLQKPLSRSDLIDGLRQVIRSRADQG